MAYSNYLRCTYSDVAMLHDRIKETERALTVNDYDAEVAKYEGGRRMPHLRREMLDARKLMRRLDEYERAKSRFERKVERAMVRMERRFTNMLRLSQMRGKYILRRRR